jgi:hypothetical protein
VRFADLSKLIRLQLPIRCRVCKMRRFAPLKLVRTLPPSTRRKHKPSPTQTSEKQSQ